MGLVAGVVLVAAALLISGCEESKRATGDARESSPADLVPRDASLYVEGAVRLRRGPGARARAFAENAIGLDIPANSIIDTVVEQLDMPAELAESFSEWPGERAGVFMLNLDSAEPGIGLVADARQQDAARRFLRKLGAGARPAAHGDIHYRRLAGGAPVGLIDGRIVITSSAAAMDAAIDGRRAPLSSTARFRRARGDGRLPFAFAAADADGVRAALRGFPQIPASYRRDIRQLFPSNAEATLRVAVSRRQALVRLDGLPAKGRAPEPIGQWPADSWLTVSSGSLGDVLENAVGRALRVSNFSIALVLDRTLGTHVPRSFVADATRGRILLGGDVTAPSADLETVVAHPRRAKRALVAFRHRLAREGKYMIDDAPASGRVSFVAVARRPNLVHSFYVELNGRLLSLSFGASGSPNELSGTRAYKMARQALGAPPTMLLDARRLLRISRGSGEPGVLDRVSFIASSQSRRNGRARRAIVVRLTESAGNGP